MGDEGESEETGEAHREPDLSIDATLELLAHHERRRILSYLANSSERAATADEIIEYIVQSEAERTGEIPNRDHIDSELYHIHLPKLADAGVLEYDPRSQQLRYWSDERLEEWLERVERDEQQLEGH